MGRMQYKGKGKGISSTVTPFKRRSARWVAHTPRTISDLIVTMAKKGMSPSQIGVIIRDKEAVPSIKLLTGQKIVRLLKKNGTHLLIQDVLPSFPKISTVWSRRLSASADICRSSERTKTPSTDSSISNPEFTDYPDITREPTDFPTSGNTPPKPQLLSSLHDQNLFHTTFIISNYHNHTIYPISFDFPINIEHAI